MTTRKKLLAVLLLATLAGCGAKRFEYKAGNEIPDGPGMFSGKDGAFTLYSDEKKDAALSADEVAELQDLKAFRRWKTSAQNTPEYREFQDWREWKANRLGKEGQAK